MAALDATKYIGRFAPSPTGPLHFGSLLAAVASYLQARAMGGEWLLRIEDIDPPRAQPGADKTILRALEAYGFEWDGPVRYQSGNMERHREIVAGLLAQGHAYRCGCSRLDLAAARRGALGVIYPGTCRAGCDAPEAAIRVRTGDTPVVFDDLLQGRQSQCLESESGDFVVLRRDGLIAYQLAVVADDFDDNVSQVVRGIDLLDSTPRQIHLQRLLGYPPPEYAHIPVVLNAAGQKLSKATGARGIPVKDPRPTLIAALNALGQPVASDLASCDLESIWAWAGDRWTMDALAHRRHIPDSLAAAENGLS